MSGASTQGGSRDGRPALVIGRHHGADQLPGARDGCRCKPSDVTSERDGWDWREWLRAPCAWVQALCKGTLPYCYKMLCWSG